MSPHAHPGAGTSRMQGAHSAAPPRPHPPHYSPGQHRARTEAPSQQKFISSGGTQMKRSISHPGTYSFDRSGVLKEYVDGGQKSTQRRNRTCSDSSVYDTERLLPSLNGDSSSIPEERGSSLKTTPTDTDTDLSI